MALTNPGHLWMIVNCIIMDCDERPECGEMLYIQGSSSGSCQLGIMGHWFSSVKLLIYSHNSPIKGICRVMRLPAQLLQADVRDPMSHIFRLCAALPGTLEVHWGWEWMPLWCKVPETNREACLLSGIIRKMKVSSVLQFPLRLPVFCN